MLILTLFSKASISLVRHHDGIIYNTGFNFNYNNLNNNNQTQQTLSTTMSTSNLTNYVNLLNKIHQHQQQQQQQQQRDCSAIVTPKPSLKRHSINL